jgi:hypothetical protein
MGSWKHRLYGLNEDKRTAVCLHCGPVGVKRKQDGWRCKQAEKKWHNHSSKPRTYKPKKRLESHPIPSGCEICGNETKLVFDHCHAKGHHRGWLCHLCNIMLGVARDNSTNLNNAIKYLAERG